MMTVCYFGTYDQKRPRNRILMENLRACGVRVIECHASPWGEAEDKSQIGGFHRLAAGIRFLYAYLSLPFRYLRVGPHDAVVVGYLGHFDMFLAGPLASLRRKPLVFDAFLSLYDTVVRDRKLVRPRSLPAKFLFWVDRTACSLADRVLLDTQAHIDFFIKTFDLPENKFHRVFVGAETELFHPCGEESEKIPEREDPSGPFRVLFYGQFIPLQGIEVIVRAAKILEREAVEFTLIGKGQESARIRRLAEESGISNIRWIEWVPYRDLREYICRADVGLGIFGETEKASQVIPNKAFQIIACRWPLITGDSPAARELFADGESAVLCKMADPESLAYAILRLKRDPVLLRRVADGGYRVFQEQCRVDPGIFLFPRQER